MESTVPKSPDLEGLEEFSKVYAKFPLYPGRAALPAAAQLNSRLLRHYKLDLLQDRAAKTLPLFVEDKDQKVAFREVDEDGSVTKWNCLSDNELQQFLRHGISGPFPEVVKNDLVLRPDPRCRFVFLLNDDRGKPLQISQSSLQRLLSFHQVSRNFLELLDVYRGTWDDDRELRSSIIRTSAVPDEPHPATIVRHLGRSGRRYQMCSSLKVPATRRGPRGDFYKIRQVALHHQFDIHSGVQLWIICDPHGLVKAQIQSYIPKRGVAEMFVDMQRSLRSSLDIHLELFGWLVEEWGTYITALDDDIHELTKIIVHDHDQAVNDKAARSAPLKDLPTVAMIQKRADEAGKGVVALSANVKVIETLDQFYTQTWEKAGLGDDNAREQCKKLIGLFRENLLELRSQIDEQIDHVKGVKHMVERRMELLSKTLERRTTVEVHRQAVRSADEAVVMRIITVITLVYLPPTFTSTFFSMEAFKEAGVTMWATVCVPLLAATVTLALFVGRRSLRNASRPYSGDIEKNGGSKHPAQFDWAVRMWVTLSGRKRIDSLEESEKKRITGPGKLKMALTRIVLRARGTRKEEDLELALSTPELR